MPVVWSAPVDKYSDSDEGSWGEDSDSSDGSDFSNDDSDSKAIADAPGDNAVSLIQLPPWLLQLLAHTCPEGRLYVGVHLLA